MAVSAPTLLGNGYDTDNQGTYTSAVMTAGAFTFSMVAGRRYYCLVHSYSAGGAELPSSVTYDPSGPDVSSFIKVTDGTDNAEQTGGQGNTGDTFSLWYFDCTVSSSGANEIDVAFSATQSACGFGVWEVTGHRHGDTGAVAHPQVVINSGTTSPATATMAALGAGNLTLFCVAINNPTGTITPSEGRTELYENDETERNNHALHYEASGTDTSLSATLNVNQAWGAFGVEVAAAEGATTDDVLIRLGSMGATDGSGLVTADFTAGAAATVFGGGYWLRRRLLDAMTSMDDV